MEITSLKGTAYLPCEEDIATIDDRLQMVRIWIPVGQKLRIIECDGILTSLERRIRSSLHDVPIYVRTSSANFRRLFQCWEPNIAIFHNAEKIPILPDREILRVVFISGSLIGALPDHVKNEGEIISLTPHVHLLIRRSLPSPTERNIGLPDWHTSIGTENDQTTQDMHSYVESFLTMKSAWEEAYLRVSEFANVLREKLESYEERVGPVYYLMSDIVRKVSDKFASWQTTCQLFFF